MVKEAKVKRRMHTKSGWNYNKVSRIVEQIHDIFNKEKVTFVEELCVLSWFHAEIIYNLGKFGAKDVIQETLKLPENPNTDINNTSYIG